MAVVSVADRRTHDITCERISVTILCCCSYRYFAAADRLQDTAEIGTIQWLCYTPPERGDLISRDYASAAQGGRICFVLGRIEVSWYK